jgi:hypothetical protein
MFFLVLRYFQPQGEDRFSMVTACFPDKSAFFARGARCKNFAQTRDRLIVKKIHEYQQHAAECRDMARTSPPAHRQQLEQMAETWEQLADARRRQLEKQGKTADEDADAN